MNVIHQGFVLSRLEMPKSETGHLGLCGYFAKSDQEKNTKELKCLRT